MAHAIPEADEPVLATVVAGEVIAFGGTSGCHYRVLARKIYCECLGILRGLYKIRGTYVPVAQEHESVYWVRGETRPMTVPETLFQGPQCDLCLKLKFFGGGLTFDHGNLVLRFNAGSQGTSACSRKDYVRRGYEFKFNAPKISPLKMTSLRR